MTFDEKFPDAADNPNSSYNPEMDRVHDVKLCFICSEYTQWIHCDKEGGYVNKPICSEECLDFHKIMRDTMK